MAYLLITHGSEEIDRRDLTGPLVVGRSPECDVGVRDIHLSRRHCRIRAAGGRWALVDLGSKNGTTVNGRVLVEDHVLCHGDVVRLGRVMIQFRAGTLVRDGLTPLRLTGPRPADPSEALSGTLAGFTLLEPGEGRGPDHLPMPQPEPPRPAAFDRDDIYSLLTTIASSSWDSIYAQAKLPTRKLSAGAEADESPRPRARPRSPIDLSLQACAMTEAEFAGLHAGDRWGVANTIANDCRLPRFVGAWRRALVTKSLVRSRARLRAAWRQRPWRRDPARLRMPAAAAAVWITAILVLALKCRTGDGRASPLDPPAASADSLEDVTASEPPPAVSVLLTNAPDDRVSSGAMPSAEPRPATPRIDEASTAEACMLIAPALPLMAF